jgi:hypothetical protein
MAKKWMQGVQIKKGALRAKAKAAGALTKNGTIDPAWLEKETHSGNPTTRKQAVLAETFKHSTHTKASAKKGAKTRKKRKER